MNIHKSSFGVLLFLFLLPLVLLLLLLLLGIGKVRVGGGPACLPVGLYFNTRPCLPEGRAGRVSALSLADCAAGGGTEEDVKEQKASFRVHC